MDRLVAGRTGRAPGAGNAGLYRQIRAAAPAVENARMSSARIGEVACTIIEAYHVSVPRYELWFAPEHVLAVWETLQAAGATPCGLEAVEALRVLEGLRCTVST
jgi:glycine cleavage system aminomethyltransferase T